MLYGSHDLAQCFELWFFLLQKWMETVLAHLNPMCLLLIQFWGGGTYALFSPVFIREEKTGMGTSQQILIAA